MAKTNNSKTKFILYANIILQFVFHSGIIFCTFTAYKNLIITTSLKINHYVERPQAFPFN